jgi:predicted secreted protein
MSDAIHGKNAKVMIGANTVAHIKKWTIKRQRDTKEETSFGDGVVPWRSFVAGLVGADVDFDGDFDPTDTNGHIALLASMTSDTALAIKCYINATNHFDMSCIVTSADTDTSVDDIIHGKYGLKVTGAGATTLI